ncbi:MAG: MraY family glycosyltransferase [bacterium]
MRIPRRILVRTGAAALLTLLFLYAAPRIDTPPWLNWTGPFLLSAVVVFGLVPLLRPLALRVGLVDRPDQRKHHEGAVPLVGGVAVYLGFLAANLFYGYHQQSPAVQGVLIAATMLVAVGMVDDLIGLAPGPKLFVQAAAVAVVVMEGVRVTFMPETWWGDSLEVAITAVWLIGMTNALNFLDGIDGLAGSLTILAAAAFGLVAVQTDQPFFLLLCAALAGGCAGFLPYNFRGRPASVFLGDAGSTLLGFSLASIAIVGEWGGPDAVTLDIVVPLLILGVPIFDTTFITITRVADGRIRSVREWLEYTGRDHIHHRLLKLGLDRRDTVGFICVIASILALSALTLHNASGRVAVLSLVQGIIILTVVGRFMLFVERRYH